MVNRLPLARPKSVALQLSAAPATALITGPVWPWLRAATSKLTTTAKGRAIIPVPRSMRRRRTDTGQARLVPLDLPWFLQDSGPQPPRASPGTWRTATPEPPRTACEPISAPSASWGSLPPSGIFLFPNFSVCFSHGRAFSETAFSCSLALWKEMRHAPRFRARQLPRNCNTCAPSLPLCRR